LGGSSRLGGGLYQRFIFAGVVGLSLLFSATFAAIVIVFDRQIGFFKAVLVAPLPRPAIAFGKIASGALQAFAHGVVLLPFAPLAGVRFGLEATVLLLGAMLLSAGAFSAMGVAVAARFTSTTVFPVISNAILLPMFFLSGALYPLQNAPHWMQIATRFDPVAYAVDLMRGSILGQFFFPPLFSIAVLIGFIALLAWAAVRVFKRGEDDSSLGATQFNWRR
jgi:ABC-2 type transport system permease protein